MAGAGDAEALLVARVARGDRAAFRELVEAHQRPLSAYAQRMLADVAQAEDIVQETFLRLWSRADRFRPEKAKLSTWLHNIAHNLCIDRFRAAGRISYTDVIDDEAGDSADPQALRSDAERAETVRRAIAALPERQRSALLLCHYQGLSNREAAEILEVSIDALESLLARGRRTLRKQLDSPYER